MEVLLDVNLIQRLWNGLYFTLYIAIISIVFSVFGGFLFGFLMTSRFFVIRLFCRLFLDMVRIIPIIVWLFLVFFGLGSIFQITSVMACIIVFSVWGIAEAGDLTRGAITSVSQHQIQSAKALGLNNMQIQLFIIFPLVILQIIPSFLNLFTRVIKTTALVSLIGVMDLLKVGQQIIETKSLDFPSISFWVYALILLIYFIVCYGLSLLGSFLEKKLDYRK